MPRLDARIKTRLPARVIYNYQANPREDVITIKELSLTGALIDNLPLEAKEMFTIKAELPDFGKVELFGDLVRSNYNAAAVRLFYSDKNVTWALWNHIREKLSNNSECPYCGHDQVSKLNFCERCGFCLNFDDTAYLDKHMKNTFAARIQSRLNRLSLENIHRVINFIDKELLKIQGKIVDKEFVGTCPAMLKVFSMIKKVAPTDMNVLILGESGTGKELTAKAIHERSARKGKSFVALNCAAIPEGLLETELFGYQKGAFTGAYATKKGKFEIADGGTIFLDEIGDLSPNLQAKLLRFLEDLIVERIGAKGGKKVDVRIIAATNCDLNSKMENDHFRRDLFYRLNAFSITLPPLRGRGEDKVILAKYFFGKVSKSSNSSLKGFSKEAIEAVRSYDWPGNVRELINKVRRGIVMATGEYITPFDLELEVPQFVKKNSLKGLVSKTKKEVVLKALEENNYVISRTAKVLGVSRPSLYSLIKKFDIEVSR